MSFRGALIGCGFFARNHIHGWADAEGAEIVAVCDRDRAKAEAFARDFGVAGVFDDAAEVLAAVRPDFVKPQPSGRHNLGTLALALAAYRSAARGEMVEMAAFVAGGAQR